jgi:PEP-CTERM motif
MKSMKILATSLAITLASIAPAQAGAIFVPGTYGVGGHARAYGDLGAGNGVGWYSYNDPNCGVGSSNCQSGGNPAFYSSSGTVDAGGRLTAYTASASAIGGVAASSAADLAAGTVKAFGASPTQGFYTLSTADAQWYDILTFNIAGAAANTVTTIRFSAVFDGTGFDTGTRDRFNNVPSAFVQSIVTIGENGFSNPFSAFGEVIANSSNGFTPTTNLYTRNRQGYGSWDPNSTVERMVFNGQFDLVGATAQQYIGLYLGINCENGAFCDFGHTGTFRFEPLPLGVTFTSASGTFLSAVGPGVGGVPEPASWAMLITGFGLVGAVSRRRRVAVAA